MVIDGDFISDLSTLDFTPNLYSYKHAKYEDDTTIKVLTQQDISILTNFEFTIKLYINEILITSGNGHKEHQSIEGHALNYIEYYYKNISVLRPGCYRMVLVKNSDGKEFSSAPFEVITRGEITTNKSRYEPNLCKLIATSNSTTGFISNDSTIGNVTPVLINKTRIYFYHYCYFSDFQSARTHQNNTVYNNDEGYVEVLQSVSFMSKLLKFGGTKGVGFYQLQALNAILCLENLHIEYFTPKSLSFQDVVIFKLNLIDKLEQTTVSERNTNFNLQGDFTYEFIDHAANFYNNKIPNLQREDFGLPPYTPPNGGSKRPKRPYEEGIIIEISPDRIKDNNVLNINVSVVRPEHELSELVDAVVRPNDLSHVDRPLTIADFFDTDDDLTFELSDIVSIDFLGQAMSIPDGFLNFPSGVENEIEFLNFIPFTQIGNDCFENANIVNNTNLPLLSNKMGSIGKNFKLKGHNTTILYDGEIDGWDTDFTINSNSGVTIKNLHNNFVKLTSTLVIREIRNCTLEELYGSFNNCRFINVKINTQFNINLAYYFGGLHPSATFNNCIIENSFNDCLVGSLHFSNDVSISNSFNNYMTTLNQPDEFITIEETNTNILLIENSFKNNRIGINGINQMYFFELKIPKDFNLITHKLAFIPVPNSFVAIDRQVYTSLNFDHNFNYIATRNDTVETDLIDKNIEYEFLLHINGNFDSFNFLKDYQLSQLSIKKLDNFAFIDGLFYLKKVLHIAISYSILRNLINNKNCLVCQEESIDPTTSLPIPTEITIFDDVDIKSFNDFNGEPTSFNFPNSTTVYADESIVSILQHYYPQYTYVIELRNELLS